MATIAIISLRLGLLLYCLVSFAKASSLTVAVASNFKAPMTTLAHSFEQKFSVKTTTIYGSSGKLFAQIQHGAPFDVFLSADQTKPIALERTNLVVSNSRFTYAIGALVLWTAKPTFHELNKNTLIDNQFNTLAIANPRLAPYGKASEELLNRLGIYQQIRTKLIQGENIAQTYQYVHTGNADLGLIASSQLQANTNPSRVWRVPKDSHAPIKQDAVILSRAANNPSAALFITYLKSDPAIQIIESFGYHTMTSTP